MLLVKEGTIAIDGTKIDLMAELSVLINTLLEKQVLNEKDLEEILRLSKLTKEEKKKEASDALIKLLDSMFGA